MPLSNLLQSGNEVLVGCDSFGHHFLSIASSSTSTCISNMRPISSIDLHL
jgi:hypothetical protein